MTEVLEVCPFCGHKRTSRWAKAAGALIAVLILGTAVVLMVGALIAAVRWAF